MGSIFLLSGCSNSPEAKLSDIFEEGKSPEAKLSDILKRENLSIYRIRLQMNQNLK